MSVASIEFLFLLLTGSALFLLLPGRRSRLILLGLCNACALTALLPNLASWLTLAVFLLSGYVVAAALRRWPSSLLLAAYFSTLIAAFLVLKKYQFLQWMLPAAMLGHPVAIVGLSYMLFRQIHFVVDSMQDQLRDVTLLAYLNYQLNFFSILSGPIMRFQQFSEYWREPQPLGEDRHEVLKGLLRINIGIIKLAIVATFCFFVFDKATSSLIQIGHGYLSAGMAKRLILLAAAFYAFPAYVYFNFSGYCDIVIGGAQLVGLKLPENFRQPYLARNMVDFWNRWHITLSNWIRDYLFMPMYKSAVQRRPTWAQPLTILFFFVALFLAGIWHGSTFNWIVFGLLNGVGVSAAKLWEFYLVKHRGRAGLKTYLNSSRIRVVAIVANVNFACFTLMFFPADLSKTIQVLQAGLGGSL